MDKINFGFDTGFGDVDPYTSFGAGGYATVNTDVSMGSPDMQPYTPTGGGSGVYIDSSQQGSFWGALEKGLNYAILRDQQKMTAVYGPPVYPAYPGQQTQGSVSLQASADKRMFTMALIGLGVYLLVRK